MLPKSFALSDDEESLRSIPLDECEGYHSDDGPISLNEYSSIAIELPQLVWHGYYNCPDALILSNTGETVSITGKWKKGRPYIAGGPLNGSYLFSQIHFHWPSEHLLNERRYCLEMHAVHYKAAYLTEERAMKEDDGTVVLVYLFEVGSEKTSISKLTCSLSRIRSKGTKTELYDSRLNDFIKPFVSNYFIYWGSANIGESKYSLQWLISCSRLCISQTELFELKELFYSGEGEPPRKQMAVSKPTSAGLFLVGGTVNAAFTEGNRSEVRFSDVEECLEAPEKSKSCCFLAKYRKKMASSRARDYSSPDGSLEKIYPKQSPSRSSVESTSSGRNDNQTPKCTGNDSQSPQQRSSTDVRASTESPSTSSTSKSEPSCPCRSISKSSDTTVNTAPKSNDPKGHSPDRCGSATSSKDEGKQNGKRKKKILKCLVRKNETHDCIGNGCENQVSSPECEKNSCDSKQNNQEEGKEAKVKRKRRESSKVGSSSEEEALSDDKPKETKEDEEESETVPNVEDIPEQKETAAKKGRYKKEKADKKGKSKGTERKEAQAQADTATEEVSKEMGQHNPIILAPATVEENQYIMKSVGTMTTHPPPPSYTIGTDVIGEGMNFFVQGPSISSSQIWRREKESETKIPEKADKSIGVSEHEESEDLELLPTRRMVAEEGVQVEMGASNPPAAPISDDERSLNSVLAALAKDPSLGKVVANLSAETLPVEDSAATTIQSLTNILTKIAEDRQLVDLLRTVSGSEKPEALDEVSAKPSSDKTKTTENSAETSALPSVSSALDKVSRQISVQTESISEEKSMATDPPSSDKEADSDVLTEKPSLVSDKPDGTAKELTSDTLGNSKHSFIINVLSEITKDPSLVAELVKTSKETQLAGVIAEALKDLTEEPKTEVNSPSKASKEPSESKASANATTQTLTRVVPHKVSKTFSGSSNIPTKANKEISESGTSVKAHKNRTLREPPEPGVSGNSSVKTSSGGIPTKASKNASGSIESTQSQNGPSLVAAEVESPKHLSGLKESANTQRRGVKASKEISDVGESAQVPKDTSSTCLLEKASKNSEVSPLDKGEISLASVLSRISKDPSLAKDLASIFRNKSVTADADPSFCGSDVTCKSPSSKDPSLASDVRKQDASIPESKTQKLMEKSSKKGEKSSKENSGEDVRKAPGEEAVVEVLKKVSTNHAVVADLAKTALVNILYAALKEPSSVADFGSSLKKQSLVSVEENPSRKISTTKTSRQSLRTTLSRRESSVSKTLSNRSAQSLASDQRPIMEFSSSKEQLLIEILEKVCTAFPATAEIVKSVSWVDILVTALKDSSSPVAERSLDNQSLVTILDRLSRESSLSSNISRREVRDNYPESVKSGAAISGKLKTSKKSGGCAIPSADDAESLKEKVEIDVSQEVSMLTPDPNGETLIDVIVSALKEPVASHGKVRERMSLGSLPENPLSASNEVDNSMKQVGSPVNNALNKLATPSAKPNLEVINSSKPLSTCDVKDCSQNETRVIPKKSSAADVLIEVLEKHPSAAEITMSLKNPFVIKLLERISKEPSLTDNATDNESSTVKSDGRTDDSKTTQSISRRPSATDSGSGKVREQPEPGIDSAAKRAQTADALTDPSVFTAVGGNAKLNADTSRRGEIADENADEMSEKYPINLSEKDMPKSPAEEVSNAGPQRRDQERNRVNFETENNRNSVETERAEAEELHRQEDLNESIKSRRSTDTKRSGEEDAPAEVKKTREERETVSSTAVEVAKKPRTSAGEKEPLPSVEKPDAVYLKARFLVKESGTVESGKTASENKASESERNGAETKKPEEAGTAEKKSMYFISEAIDVDPETGKKVLTGRFVTHNKSYYLLQDSVRDVRKNLYFKRGGSNHLFLCGGAGDRRWPYRLQTQPAPYVPSVVINPWINYINPVTNERESCC